MNLKIIKLSDIEDEANSYFHFTSESHMHDNEKGLGVPKVGLSNIPRERPHAVPGDEKNPCIYFSQGFGGILELIDIWIRWEYNNSAMKDNKPLGHIAVDKKTMEKAYEVMYKKFKNAVYLKLELQPGDDPKTSDFNPKKEDFRKNECFRDSIYHEDGAVDDKAAKWCYGVNSDLSVATMDRWNMSTHLTDKKHDIPPEKITILQDSRGRTDALSILLEIYINYKYTAKNIYDLDKFIQYVIERNKQHENTQPPKNDFFARIRNIPPIDPTNTVKLRNKCVKSNNPEIEER